jgi:hypothetical protein
MREDSRVPPSRSSPDSGDQSSDGALVMPPTRGESSLPESATAAADATLEQAEAAKSSSSLPRRVRGSNGARPPARVERPVLPESFLERFRAAAAASEAREADGEDKAAAGPEAPDDRSARFDQATQSKPAAASSPLPHRVHGTNGAPKPPAQLRPPFPIKVSDDHPSAPGATTQPIPVVSDAPATEMPGDAARSAAAGAAEQEAAAPPRGASAEESAGEKPADAATAAPPQPMNPPSAEPGGKKAADSRPTAPTVIPAQRSVKHQAHGKAVKSAAAKNRTGQGYRMIGLLVIVVALAIGVGSFAALHHGGHSGHKAHIPSAQIPLAIRNTAGAWVASQVAASDTVACDPVMCQALKAHGMTASRLRVQWPGSDSLSGSAIVVATPVLQSQLGSKLDSAYAPEIIARFGSGERQIVIRAAAPHGAAAYRSDLASDLTERKAAGVTFAYGPASSELSAVEKKQLAAGQVDSRLIVLIAELETRHQVRIAAFGDASPGVNETAAPLRSADLVITSNAIKRSLLDAVGQGAARWRQYRPAHVHTLRLPTGQMALRIEFAAPSPLGLLD